PPSSWYSTDATPESSSVAWRRTNTEPRYSPASFFSPPMTRWATSGATVSLPSPSTTANVTLAASDTLPASSVARYASVSWPGSSTTTAPVYSAQPAPSRAYSTGTTPGPALVAVRATDAAPTYAPVPSCAPPTSCATLRAVVTSPASATTASGG